MIKIILPTLLSVMMILSRCWTKTIQLSSVEKLSPDNIPQSVNVESKSNGLIDELEGNFVDFSVENEEDADKVIYYVSDLIQCKDPENELRITYVEDALVSKVYYFTQYYNDLPIDGYVTSLFVNKDNNAVECFKNSYIPNISVDTNPKFTKDDLIKMISDEYESEIDGVPELKVSFAYTRLTGSPQLVWYTRINNHDVSYLTVDANNGKVLYEEGPQY